MKKHSGPLMAKLELLMMASFLVKIQLCRAQHSLSFAGAYISASSLTGISACLRGLPLRRLFG